MMVSQDERGKRLLACVIDSYAISDPNRVWASAPFDNDDLTAGFRDISYKELANAVNHASWWLEDTTANNPAVFETLAYAGPKDLRYPILALAAVKCGKQLLLASPFATPEAQKHLLRITKCSTYIHAFSFRQKIRSVLGTNSDVRLLAVPGMNEWLFREEARVFPYKKTWAEANSDPWLIFHTSGTTGLPRPIVYTNWMMTSFDAADLMPDTDQETMNDHFRNSRCYISLPHLHFVGMTVALQWTTFLNTVLVVGPPDAVTADQVIQILELGNATGAVLPPSLIEDVCRYPKGVNGLRSLEYVYFVGAPLPQPIAEKLVGHCKVQPAMGSTEAGAYFIQIRNDDDWDYYCFRSAMGVQFEQRTEGLYELVFRRQQEYARWQQLFQIYPNLDEFPTKDLWTKHPSKPNLWRYSGRTDDLVVLSHGEGLYASDMEAEIQKHPDVRIALIGGQGRPRPFLIIDLLENALPPGSEKESILTDIWPYIVTANERCSDYVKLTRSLVIFTVVERPLPRTAKDTVFRQPSFSLYSPEIERLYRE